MKYFCTECSREIPWDEYRHRSDIFCSECGGQIEEITEDLASQAAVNQLSETKDTSTAATATIKLCLITCVSCGKNFSIRANKCPSCGEASPELKKCEICHHNILASSSDCPNCGDPSPFSYIEIPNSVLSYSFKIKGEKRKVKSIEEFKELVRCHEITFNTEAFTPKYGEFNYKKISDFDDDLLIEMIQNISAVNKYEMLIKCASCANDISVRAKVCPKCRAESKKKCEICESLITPDSAICPECGDPSPFELLEKTKKKEPQTSPVNSHSSVGINTNVYTNEAKPSSISHPSDESTKTGIVNKNQRPLWQRILFMLPAYVVWAIIRGIIKDTMEPGIVRIISLVALVVIFLGVWNMTKYRSP